MIVSIHLQEHQQVIHQLKLDENYDEAAELKLLNSNSQPVKGLTIDYSIHYMPGFCLIEEVVNTNLFETIELRVEGECYLTSLYSAGKFEITDYENDCTEFNVAGSIKISASSRANWALSVYPKQNTHRYILILSEVYLSAFLENEKWISFSTLSLERHYAPKRAAHFKNAYIDGPIKNILAELSNANYENVYRRAFVELKLKELMFLIHTQQKENKLEDELPPSVYQKLISAKAYLISNYVDAPSIIQLSRIISLNQFYLKMHFKRLFGTTIHQFIIQLRMEAAKTLLKANCSVLETSARTGYRSTSHFITVFKNYYGKTPKQAVKELKVL